MLPRQCVFLQSTVNRNCASACWCTCSWWGRDVIHGFFKFQRQSWSRLKWFSTFSFLHVIFFSHKKLFRGTRLPLLFEKHHKHFLCCFMRKVMNTTLLCRKFYMCDSRDSLTPRLKKNCTFYSVFCRVTSDRPAPPTCPEVSPPRRPTLCPVTLPHRCTPSHPTSRLRPTITALSPPIWGKRTCHVMTSLQHHQY